MFPALSTELRQLLAGQGEPELAAQRMEDHINDTRHTIEAWAKR